MPTITKADKKTPPWTSKQLRDLVNGFDWKTWQKKLEPGFTQVYRDLVVVSAEGVADQHDVSFDQDDPFLERHMTEYVGERITQLSRTSKKDVIRTIRTAFATADDNLSVGELQDRILGAVREKYKSYDAYRALRIARTESAIGYNQGNVLGAAQSGFGKVDVVDGTDDEPCREANGAVWTTTKALQNPIAHPSCTRAFFPHVEDDETPAEE